MLDLGRVCAGNGAQKDGCHEVLSSNPRSTKNKQKSIMPERWLHPCLFLQPIRTWLPLLQPQLLSACCRTLTRAVTFLTPLPSNLSA
jgi:hypothetical protein